MTIESIYKADFVNLEKGDLVYYASFIAASEDRPHLLQLTQVQKVNDTTIFLDNGKKFSIGDEREACRGDGGCLYEYSTFNEAMVKEAQAKLSVLNNVEAIDFSSLSLSRLITIYRASKGELANVESIDFEALSTQQLSMIHDVARGAFTLATNSTPCGGGCSDTMESDGQSIQISGLAFDVENARKNGWGMDTSPRPLVPPFQFDPANPPMVMNAQGNIYNPDGTPHQATNTPVMFADATFELSDSDEDDDDNDDDDDDTEAVE